MTQQPGPRVLPTSTRGPKIMTLSGVAALAAGLAALGAAVGLFVTALPLDVLTLDGRPGSGAVAVVPVPGSESVMLDAGAYLIYLAAPRGTSGGFEGAITVTGSDGAAVRVGSSSTSESVSAGSTEAHTVAGFGVPADGEYVITAPPHATSGDARLLVLDDPGIGAFLGQVLGTVGAVFLGIGLGIVGLALTIGGGIWWSVRRKAGAAAAPPER